MEGGAGTLEVPPVSYRSLLAEVAALGFLADLLRRLSGKPEPSLEPSERVRAMLARMNPADRSDAEAIRQEVMEDYGSEEAADTWLSSKMPFLGDVRPIDIMHKAKGRGAVRDVLNRIRYGIYS